MQQITEQQTLEPILEVESYEDLNAFLDVICASADCYNESVISDIKQSVVNIADLWKQWKKATKNFINHKWIYRYIDEKQKEALKKHYAVLCAEKTNYSSYKRSFAAICKFVGLQPDVIILENVVFTKDDIDRKQDIIAVKYSKGKVRVTIPEGVKLIHVHTTEDNVVIRDLIPSFRSKTVGKYMYPSKRCFFSCIKAIPNNKAGLHGTMHKYTPKEHIKYAYIDPTYSDFASNSVYIETENPIPVEDFVSFMQRLFKKKRERE